MNERDELVARLRAMTEDDTYKAPWIFDTHCRDAADQVDRDGREIKKLTAENERLREALADLLTAYAACNGEDHPAYRRARAAMNGEGET